MYLDFSYTFHESTLSVSANFTPLSVHRCPCKTLSTTLPPGLPSIFTAQSYSHPSFLDSAPDCGIDETPCGYAPVTAPDKTPSPPHTASRFFPSPTYPMFKRLLRKQGKERALEKPEHERECAAFPPNSVCYSTTSQGISTPSFSPSKSETSPAIAPLSTSQLLSRRLESSDTARPSDNATFGPPFYQFLDVNRTRQAGEIFQSPRSAAARAKQSLDLLPDTPSPEPAVDRERSSADPVLQFSSTSTHAGRDIASRNVVQQGEGNMSFGDGNQVHIYSVALDNRHEAMIHRITGQLGSYFVGEAVLTKDIHGQPSVCYEGTRVNLLEHVLLWVEARGVRKDGAVHGLSSRAQCIVGAPGTGKSTIINTIIINLLSSATLRCPGLISAHYSIRRSLQSTTDEMKVLSTLVLQLAHRAPGVAERVSQLIDGVPHTGVFSQTFLEHLFLQAIYAYDQTVLVIIDALDEVSNPTSLSASLARIIRLSPPNLRLLIATRNEHDVLVNLGAELVSAIVYRIPTEGSVCEVHDYIAGRLREGLKEIFGHGHQTAWEHWPDEIQIQSLSDRADGLFIWARTAIDFILSRIRRRGTTNRDQLIQDVERTGTADVNALYTLILKNFIAGDEGDELLLSRVKSVLGLIVIQEHPLSLDEMTGFLGFHDFDVHHLIEFELRSLLVPGTGTITGSTTPQIHKTFLDFLTSARAAEFQIDIEDCHRSAVVSSFALMKSHLHFNMYGLRSSFAANDEVMNVPERAANLVKGLAYACSCWGYHLQNTTPSFLPLEAPVKSLLYEHLLHWLEVVGFASIVEDGPQSVFPHKSRRKAEEAASSLSLLSDRLGHKESTGVGMSTANFANDAAGLVARFKTCIDTSIPHIYVSILAFSSTDSVVIQHYRARAVTMVIPPPLNIPLHTNSGSDDHKRVDSGRVQSVSFSPCGARLAVGYHDWTIRVWNVQTGICLLGPLVSHADDVRAVCYSPNGLLLASCSSDATVCVWSSSTGERILGPLRGHESIVASVSFSPDSTRIVSGALDGTICVWDAHTGDCVLDLLEGHCGGIRSVLYSPDGSCIASSSDDETIILWDSVSGQRILGPLEGHTDRINSIAFSPSGLCLVSGSEAKTLRIWDIGTGMCTHGPLRGHAGSVLSVCFSPDGQFFASGSDDQTIRLWDAKTGACILGPIGGSVGSIPSIDFSPDGKYLAAGSINGAIRLLDVEALVCTSIGQHEKTGAQEEASAGIVLTDQTTVDRQGWTLGTNGERLFWAPEPYNGAIWRPSTTRVLGRPTLIKPDLSRLVTGEEWLDCFSA